VEVLEYISILDL